MLMSSRVKWFSLVGVMGCATLVTLGVTFAHAQDKPEAPPQAPSGEMKKAEVKEEPHQIKELVISPAPEPKPALRYRLMPLAPDRTPGDAAPIYLRAGMDIEDEGRKALFDRADAWLDMPLNELPKEDMEKYLDQWHLRIEQIEFAARRQTCTWNYTLPEQRENSVAVMLPDMNEMRRWIRVIAIKARLEIVEHRWDDAARTLETGLSFSRHIGEGPFLINGLVAISCESIMLERVEEWIGQPGSPNLYWSLTVLPRPIVSLHAALESEERFADWMFPEMAEADRSHAEAEWASLLARFHQRLVDFARINSGYQAAPEKVAGRMKDYSLETMRKELTPRARPFLKERRGMSDAEVKAMSDDQALMLFLVGRFRDLRSEVLRMNYIPYREGKPFYSRMEEAVKAANESDPPLALLTLFLDGIGGNAETRPERRLAAYRTIEAIRMYASSHDAAFPSSLDAIQDVPLPIDPVTGQPFEYKPDGDGYLLTGPDFPIADAKYDRPPIRLLRRK